MIIKSWFWWLYYIINSFDYHNKFKNGRSTVWKRTWLTRSSCIWYTAWKSFTNKKFIEFVKNSLWDKESYDSSWLLHQTTAPDSHVHLDTHCICCYQWNGISARSGEKQTSSHPGHDIVYPNFDYCSNHNDFIRSIRRSL